MKHDLHKNFPSNSRFLSECKILKDLIIWRQQQNILNNKAIYVILTSETSIIGKKRKRKEINHKWNFRKNTRFRNAKQTMPWLEFSMMYDVCFDYFHTLGYYTYSFSCHSVAIESSWCSKMEKQWLCNTRC